jgi:SNF2 family DNA or RNA helicase
VDAVYKTLNTYKNRILLADDVGLGKTIETGMILKELSLRGFANRLAFDDATGKTINEDILPIFVTHDGDINFPASRVVAEFNNEIRDASSCDVDKFLPKIENLHPNAYSAALQKAKDFCTSVQMRKSREINIKREDAEKYFERRTKEEEERLKDYRANEVACLHYSQVSSIKN